MLSVICNYVKSPLFVGLNSMVALLKH